MSEDPADPLAPAKGIFNGCLLTVVLLIGAFALICAWAAYQ